ncbi:OmpW family protein [Sphingobacterium sp. JB170]|uniref:OmpW/AlkL family protein n=1 Tax=Sphingobacterium sp. JB170 TaxID=1434842 RepID=UPI00097EA6F8|nr:OmpW family outer membrane protein [Sphingobacterium sp. JB170]SJN22863.1 Outer membrane protein W precursor [Sphingobacterium sp. JB170]
MDTSKLKIISFCLVLIKYLITANNLYAQEDDFKSFSVKLYGGYSKTNETSYLKKVGGKYELGNSAVAGFGLTWFLTPDWSAEVSASAGRYHIKMTDGDYNSMQVLRDEIPLGRVWIAPVSLSVKYHINQWKPIKPFIGAGRTFMLFDKPDPGWAADAVEYHSRSALHIGIGTDYYITDCWFVQLDIRHFLASRANVNPDFTKSVGWKLNGQLKPDPAQVTLGIGYRF